jgi:hypothetical protein
MLLTADGVTITSVNHYSTVLCVLNLVQLRANSTTVLRSSLALKMCSDCHRMARSLSRLEVKAVRSTLRITVPANLNLNQSKEHDSIL